MIIRGDATRGSKWIPAKKTESYYANYDKIKWDSDKTVLVRKGKSRINSVLRDLYVKETVEAARTPLGKRTEKTFQHLY